MSNHVLVMTIKKILLMMMMTIDPERDFMRSCAWEKFHVKKYQFFLMKQQKLSEKSLIGVKFDEINY